MNMKTKKIYILFTRYPGRDAKLLMWRTKFPYTHTSIGLEEDMDTFYKFISKGFLVEKVTKYEKPGRQTFPCALYEINVTEEQYNRVKETVLSYVENKANLKYSTLGLIGSFIGVSFKRKNHYFCSQFVAEVLEKCEVVKLKKKSSLCFANDIVKLEELKLVFEGTHLSYVQKFVKTSDL